MKKLLLFCSLFTILLCFPVNAPSEDAVLAALKAEKDELAVSDGHAERPVVESLSRIVQREARSDDDAKLHKEEDLEEERLDRSGWRYGKPSFTPIHSLQIDGGSNLEKEKSPLPMAPQMPALKSSFAGIPNQGNSQPDSIIAVGPQRIMLAVNTVVGIYTKTGERKFLTTFEEWFAPLGAEKISGTLFDPKVLYDHYSGHFIFMCNSRAHHRSWFLFSVSKTSDPEGEWAYWAFDMQITGGKREVFWADFPRIGFDQNAIYLSGNMTEFGSLRFRYAKVRVLRKSQVYKFGPVTWREFARMTDANNLKAINIEPVVAFGNAPSGYLVSTTPFLGQKITLWTIVNPGSPNPSIRKRGITVSTYEVPPLASQRGGGPGLNTRDAGVYNAIYRNGSIYTAHNTAHDFGSGPFSAIRYNQFKPNGQIVEEITYGKNGFHYFYPVVMPDSRGNVIIGFNRSGNSAFAGIFFTGRKATDPPGKLGGSRTISNGFATYQVVFRGSDVGRWGDYNGIALDSDDSVYIFSEYARTRTTWETKVGRVSY